MVSNWILRILLCFVLISQIPGSSAELLVAFAEGEWLLTLIHLGAVIGDVFFSYKVLRDGIE
ncbi:hypothetical protein [Magnetospirillum fulvum]|uniref:Uncharacterized protein n=1 Tax=Magnetospirillum fulvum TaxID=1082 RepID=A0A1H6IVT4_MAGFU|nr:hypothetical protein [Magnetospirillum fulvum]SEH51207.1 hypothetical protein SAMN04244559_02699 [Magnetospirillum fulvum]